MTRTTALLGAVRCATAGTEPGESAAAPYAAGPWLFSHNGAIKGWPDIAVALADTLPAADLLALQARCDSALLWAVVLQRLRAGASLAAALEGTLALVDAERVAGRFNFLLTDGHAIAATALGDTLCYRHGEAHVVVASEPGDDEPDWTWVPDGSVLTATAAEVSVRPLAANRRTATG